MTSPMPRVARRIAGGLLLLNAALAAVLFGLAWAVLHYH